jgi:protein disulfide-isomerase A6
LCARFDSQEIDYLAGHALPVISFLFACFSFSTYIELTDDNAHEHIGGPKPIFVKFYSPSCPHCIEMADDFDQASRSFAHVNFGGANCESNPALCAAHEVNGYPTLYFFPPRKKTGILYTGMRAFDDFCDFLENSTHYKSDRSSTGLTNFDPTTLAKQISAGSCLLVTFYLPQNPDSKDFLSEARKASPAFAQEPNVSFGSVNCDLFGNLCEQYGVDNQTAMKIVRQGQTYNFSGARNTNAIVSYINRKCKTDRSPSGALNEFAGLIREAQPLVTEFFKSDDKRAVIEQVKRVSGAEYYAKVMERYLSQGAGQIEKDVGSILGLMDVKKSSQSVVDGMKRRLNVLKQFIMTPVVLPDDDEL